MPKIYKPCSFGFNIMVKKKGCRVVRLSGCLSAVAVENDENNYSKGAK